MGAKKLPSFGGRLGIGRDPSMNDASRHACEGELLRATDVKRMSRMASKRKDQSVMVVDW